MYVTKEVNTNNEISWLFDDGLWVKEVHAGHLWFAVYDGMTFLGYIKPKTYKEYMNMCNLLSVGNHPIAGKWNLDVYSLRGWELMYTIPILNEQRKYKRTVEAFLSVYEAAQFAPKDAPITVVSGMYARRRVWAFVQPGEGITLDDCYLLSDIEDIWNPDDDSVVIAY